jgi:hypothetical protein
LKESRVASKKSPLKPLSVIVLPSSIIVARAFYGALTYGFAEAEHRPKSHLEVTNDLYPSESTPVNAFNGYWKNLTGPFPG